MLGEAADIGVVPLIRSKVAEILLLLELGWVCKSDWESWIFLVVDNMGRSLMSCVMLTEAALLLRIEIFRRFLALAKLLPAFPLSEVSFLLSRECVLGLFWVSGILLSC